MWITFQNTAGLNRQSLVRRLQEILGTDAWFSLAEDLGGEIETYRIGSGNNYLIRFPEDSSGKYQLWCRYTPPENFGKALSWLI